MELIIIPKIEKNHPRLFPKKLIRKRPTQLKSSRFNIFQNRFQQFGEKIDSARARLKAELELARAQSALDTLREAVTGRPVAPVADEELIVLRAASDLTKKWVKDDQGPLLESVSGAIAALARLAEAGS